MRRNEYWSIAIGLLEKVSGIVSVRRHLHVGDTVDGGFATLVMDDLERLKETKEKGDEFSPIIREPEK